MEAENEPRAGFSGGCGIAFVLFFLTGVAPFLILVLWQAGPAHLWRAFQSAPMEDQIGTVLAIVVAVAAPFALLVAGGIGWKTLYRVGRHLGSGPHDNPN